MSASPPEILLGLLLVFGLPGYAITKATFPDWRLKGPEALLRAVEVGTLSLVLSVGVTILVGFVLGNLPGGLFQAGWNDPLLEAVLGGITAVALVVGVLRGAFAREPPPAAVPEASPGEEDPVALVRRLEATNREIRRLRHQLRTLRREDPERSPLEAELADAERRSQELRSGREAEYAR